MLVKKVNRLPSLGALRRLAVTAEEARAEARDARADAIRAAWAPLPERDAHARRANGAASRARAAARAIAGAARCPESLALARQAGQAAEMAEHDAAYSTARAVTRFALGEGVRS